MKIKALAQCWEQQAKATFTMDEYSLRLPIEDAAKIDALAEMYPKRNKNEILGELLSAALDELETGFPYKAGNKIISRDEVGDPLFEDIGPTPKFINLSKKHYSSLKQQGKKAANN